MRKQSLWSIIKDELIYWILILLLSGFFLYLTTINASRNTLMAVGFLNVLLLETWFIRTFILYSGRKISKYSEVIQRTSLQERFFDYFILPIIFLSTFMTYLYYNTNILMAYWVMALCMGVIFALFVNVKSSLGKVYRISSLTKGIFDLICIVTFYLSLNVLFRFDLNVQGVLLMAGGLAMIMFLSELQLHDRLNLTSLLIAFVSSVFVSLAMGVFIFQSIFIATAVGTLAFYLIISLWNIRFSGKYKFTDYLVPFIYGIIALILIFNL
jgi:hypothetical protein